jgi:hypothetical protein
MQAAREPLEAKGEQPGKIDEIDPRATVLF